MMITTIWKKDERSDFGETAVLYYDIPTELKREDIAEALVCHSAFGGSWYGNVDCTDIAWCWTGTLE